MASAPHVSIVVTTYNRARLVTAAIDSVLRQSFQDIEIIIVDDGSSDHTAARVAAFAEPIRYIRLEHSGRPSRVRNRGIGVARGSLIAFLDDDDVWRPDKLARQVGFLDQHSALGFVYSDLRFQYPDGTLSAPVLRPHQKETGALFDRLLSDCFIYPSTVIVRRHLLDRVGLFDEALAIGEDYDLWLRLARAADAGCIPEPMVTIRRHPSGLSQQSEYSAYHNAIFILERLAATNALSLRRHLRVRLALARLHTHVGLTLLKTDEIQQARRHFTRSLRLNPLQRRAWQALAQSLPADQP